VQCKLRVVPAIALLSLTAACGSSLIVKQPSTKGVRTVSVTVAGTGCTPEALAAVAGPTVFVVKNVDSTTVSEFEIHQGNDILAEAEFVTVGLAKSFAITLQPGHYTTLCTGGTRNHGRGTLTVTGHVAKPTDGPSAQASARAVAKYRDYVEAQATLLVTRTTELVHAVEAGNVALAKSLYTPARIPYERIEPVAKSFADLYLNINARQTDVTSGHWNGFHRIERALYQEGDVTAMGPTASQLLADVTTLAARVKTVRMEPATIANGAIDLLNEVTTVKLTGQEDVDAHTDLSDAAANVEGAQAAFDAIAPLLPKHGSVTAAPVDTRLQAVITALAPLRRGSGYVAFDQLTPTETRTLVQAVDAAAERLSLAPKALVG
jgi:iron uptake system component EfeO